eukprot:1146561-Pelagomonas_calceolata.AAC.1
MDGDKRARVHPTNGVKQGCPLSPLLFSLYINDMGKDISEGIRGDLTGDGVNGVSYMLYADDLSLNTNDPGEMQVMLNRLQAYAMRKGLTVNTSKSEEHAVRPCMAAQQRIKKFVHEPHCMAFRLGCTRAKCGVQNIYEKAVSSKAIAEKALTLLEAFSTRKPSSCKEYRHELASIERVWPRAFAVLLV